MNRKKQMIGNQNDSWIDEVMETQERDLMLEEEILSSVPTRMKSKWIGED